jgi:hypothetical protein
MSRLTSDTERIIVHDSSIDPYDEESIAKVLMMYHNMYYPVYVNDGVMHLQHVEVDNDRLN